MNTRPHCPRHLILPARGALLISTDLHGNGDDFRQLRKIFLELCAREPAAHWVLLGDLVHGPDLETQRTEPALYGYPDESWAVVEGVIELARERPQQIHLLLGNHDHGHVGGPHTSRFHDDEVSFLESTLSRAQRASLQRLFEEALLLVMAPCGVVLSHGCPGALLHDVAELERLSLRGAENDEPGGALLGSLLTAYGQPEEITRGVLRDLGRSSGLSLGLQVHGHDRDEAGWFSDNPHQLCPVIFGAPREEKRYLLLDLAARYPDTTAVRDGIELRRLHGSSESR